MENENSVIGKLHQRIGEKKAEAEALYLTFLARSKEYQGALEIKKEDFKILLDNQGRPSSIFPKISELPGFLTLDVEEKVYNLMVVNVCGISYGGNWSEEIMAVCVNDKSLNKTKGGGTSLINVVNEDAHQDILEAIKGSERTLFSVDV